MDDEESGLVMPLYWRCQELQNRLIDVKDRKGVIVRFIEVIGKCKNKVRNHIKLQLCILYISVLFCHFKFCVT